MKNFGFVEYDPYKDCYCNNKFSLDLLKENRHRWLHKVAGLGVDLSSLTAHEKFICPICTEVVFGKVLGDTNIELFLQFWDNLYELGIEEYCK